MDVVVGVQCSAVALFGWIATQPHQLHRRTGTFPPIASSLTQVLSSITTKHPGTLDEPMSDEPIPEELYWRNYVEDTCLGGTYTRRSYTGGTYALVYVTFGD